MGARVAVQRFLLRLVVVYLETNPAKLRMMNAAWVWDYTCHNSVGDGLIGEFPLEVVRLFLFLTDSMCWV